MQKNKKIKLRYVKKKKKYEIDVFYVIIENIFFRFYLIYKYYLDDKSILFLKNSIKLKKYLT